MLSVYPELSSIHCKCPDCGCELSQPHSLLFQGQHVLADIECTCCEIDYYQTVPVGHAAHFPVSFTKDGRKTRFVDLSKQWMALPLIRSMCGGQEVEVQISLHVYDQKSEVVVLNCLDSCWGHVFQKLLNATYHLQTHPEIGVIILLPESLKWLVPKGVAEVWSVNVPLESLNRKIANLNTFVRAQFSRFDKVYLSEAPIQPQVKRAEIAQYVKTAPFSLDQFNTGPFWVTFVWREDRFWLSHPIEETLYFFSIKTGLLKYWKWYFAYRQMQKFKSVANVLRKQYPTLNTKVVGLGRLIKAPSILTDKRTSFFTEEQELEQCGIYAQSHLVIGVHGSNMLLPTALAASFIELVPRWKLDRMGEDILQSYTDRTSHYLGRFVDGYASPKLVAAHAVSLLGNFKHFRTVLVQKP